MLDVYSHLVPIQLAQAAAAIDGRTVGPPDEGMVTRLTTRGPAPPRPDPITTVRQAISEQLTAGSLNAAAAAPPPSTHH